MWKKIISLLLAFSVFSVWYSPSLAQTSNNPTTCTRQKIIQNIYKPFTHSNAGGQVNGHEFPYLYRSGGSGDRSPDKARPGDDEYSLIDTSGGTKPDDTPDKFLADVKQLASAQGCQLNNDTINWFSKVYFNVNAHDWEVDSGSAFCRAVFTSWKSFSGDNRLSRSIFGDGCANTRKNNGENNDRWDTGSFRVFLAEDFNEVEDLIGRIPASDQACTVQNVQEFYHNEKANLASKSPGIGVSADPSEDALQLARSVYPEYMDKYKNYCNIQIDELFRCFQDIYTYKLSHGSMPDESAFANTQTLVQSNLTNCSFTSVSSDEEQLKCSTDQISTVWDDIKIKKSYEKYAATDFNTFFQNEVVSNKALVVINNGNSEVCRYSDLRLRESFQKAFDYAKQNPSDGWPEYIGSYQYHVATDTVTDDLVNVPGCGTQSYTTNKGAESLCCAPIVTSTNPLDNPSAGINDNVYCTDNNNCASSIAGNADSLTDRLYGNATFDVTTKLGYCKDDATTLQNGDNVALQPYNEPNDNNNCRCKPAGLSDTSKKFCNRFVASSIIKKAGCQLQMLSGWGRGKYLDKLNYLDSDDIDRKSYTTDKNNWAPIFLTGKVVINGEIGAPDLDKKIRTETIADNCSNLGALSYNVTADHQTDSVSGNVLTVEDIKRQPEYGSCIRCVDVDGGIPTGIGCIKTKTFQVFIEDTILGWGIGLAGIMSLLCIIFSALQLQLSQGNPERIKKTQEMLTSCITGLILIIFSVFILRFIGVDILRIPGLGR